MSIHTKVSTESYRGALSEEMGPLQRVPVALAGQHRTWPRHLFSWLVDQPCYDLRRAKWAEILLSI